MSVSAAVPLLLAFLIVVVAGLSGCAENPSVNTTAPTYSTNGSYDDNGAEPVPNSGDQNFGRRR